MTGGPPGTLKSDNQTTERREWRPIVTGLLAMVGIALTVLAAFVLAMGQLQLEVPPPEASPVGGQVTPTPTVEIVAPLTSPSSPESPGGTDTPTIIPAGEPTLTATPSPALVAPPPTPTPIIIVVTTTPTCRPPNGWVVYTVRQGETLASIAARYNVSVSLLMEANCLASQAVYPGQPLFVPPPVPPPPTATPTKPSRPPCQPPQGWVRYTVQPSDTLQSLAQRTNTSVNILVQANCLTSYEIRPGQTLWLPVFPGPPPPPSPTATFPSPATPTWTPTPTFTPSPSPTRVTDTPTPTATWTSEPPTATPTATWTSEPPTPTPTATGTSTPPPTNTPAPFPTPEGGT